MSTTVSVLLAKARTQLGGYYPGVSPYGQWYGTKVGAYSTYAAAQFCGMFVSWVAGQVGALDIIPLHAYTPSGVAWFKAKGQWHNGKAGARAGDIVYFDFPGEPHRVSHVGIVESVNSDGSLNTIEGNTSSVVGGDQRNGRTVARKRRASSIVGFGRPAYVASTPDTRPRNADGSLRIDEDGKRGPATIARWQEVMGTLIDGVISTPRSKLIEADQRFLNAVIAAEHIRNLTGKDKLDVDGDEGPKTIRVRQFWLYNTQAPAVLGRGARIEDFDGKAGPETTRLHQHALNVATARSGRY